MHKSRSYAGDGNTVGEIRQQAVEAGFWIGHINPCKLAEDTKDPGTQNAPQDISLYVLYKKNGCDQKSDEG